MYHNQNNSIMKKKGILWGIISMALVVTMGISVASCGDDKEDPATISANPNSLNFTADGGTQVISISSNTNWQISGNGGWCSVSPTSGSGNQTVTVTTFANSSTNNQNCVLTIQTKDGKVSTAVVVNQAGKSGPVGPDPSDFAAIVAGTYVGKLISGGEVVNDAYKIILTKLNSTSVEMDAAFFYNNGVRNVINFNVSMSQNQYVLTNSNYTDLTITVTGKVLNVSFVNAAGTLTTFSGNKD